MEEGTSYPVQFDVEYPDRELNRLTTGFRIFMAIPIAIVLATLGGESTAYAGTTGRPARPSAGWSPSRRCC